MASLRCLRRDALMSSEGQAHFAQGEQAEWDMADEWRPDVCNTQNCSVRILHISAQGFDEGLIENLVETLKVPAKVAYLGQENHTQVPLPDFERAAYGSYCRV